MNILNKLSILLILLLMITLSSDSAYSQTGPDPSPLTGADINVIGTAVPLLRATPDARAGGMGELGLATKADATALFWNAAKLPFNTKPSGFSVTYTPWLRQLGVDDIFLSNVTGFFKMDNDQALAASLRYFSFGSIQFTDINGNNLNSYKPNEFYIDLGYSRKLSTNFSTGLVLKYIYSDLAKGQQSNGNLIRAGQSVAADLSFFLSNPMSIGNSATWDVGLNLSNIGAKISYTDDSAENTKDFIPTNLGLGTALNVDVDGYNAITVGLDVNKLLVPTPLDDGSHREIATIPGMLGSFGDAPGSENISPGAEELSELMYSLGLEYWYNSLFAVRAGYFHESKNKGNRKYFTAGVGIKYQVFGINVSYLIPAVNLRTHPLANTLRFSLLFDFEAIAPDASNEPKNL